jgi:hypothetical protein
LASIGKTWTRKIDPAARAVHLVAVLKGPTGLTSEARFVVDTGTPVTILNHELAKYLDLGPDRSEGPSRLWGPTGADDGYRIRLASIRVMDRDITERQIRCHKLCPDVGVDGLIGLDILRMGRFTLDLPWGLVEFKWN